MYWPYYQQHNLKHAFGLRWAIAYNWQKHKYKILLFNFFTLCPFYTKSFKIDSQDDVGAWNNNLIIIKNYCFSILEIVSWISLEVWDKIC